MIGMHSKYDYMHKNVIFYALIYINNHIIACSNCMLSFYPLMRERENFFSFLYKRDRNVAANHGPLITCIYNLNSYLILLIFKLILCNYDACYLNFMNFLH